MSQPEPQISVRKSQRNREPFSAEKLRISLRRAGASRQAINEVMEQIRPQLRDGISTTAIQRMAGRLLKRRSRKAAVTYSLKRALLQLGPSGFPFEQFCGRLFEAMGYKVEYNQTLAGRCVTHEVDIVARRNGKTLFAECKFHNRAGYRNDVKMPLYIKARSMDLQHTEQGAHDQFWLLSNTMFSEDALTYADCVGLILAGHNTDHYPLTRDLINQHGLHPITCLSRLKQAHKRALIDADVLLCREVIEQPGVLTPLNISDRETDIVLRECRDIIQSAQAKDEEP